MCSVCYYFVWQYLVQSCLFWQKKYPRVFLGLILQSWKIWHVLTGKIAMFLVGNHKSKKNVCPENQDSKQSVETAINNAFQKRQEVFRKFTLALDSTNHLSSKAEQAALKSGSSYNNNKRSSMLLPFQLRVR